MHLKIGNQMITLSKAGMKKEAVLRGRRIDKFTGQRSDLVIYSITKSELAETDRVESLVEAIRNV